MFRYALRASLHKSPSTPALCLQEGGSKLSESEVSLVVGVAGVSGALLGVFISALLSRASATSALRQDWINSLREVLSGFLNHAEKWVDIPDKNSEEAYWAKNELLSHIHQAKLYINEKEAAPEKLMKKMEGIPSKYQKIQKASEVYRAEKQEITSLMQQILKDEWNRVRDGEILWSVNKLFKLIGLPSWFYLSRIRFFWLAAFALIIWGALRLCECFAGV